MPNSPLVTCGTAGNVAAIYASGTAPVDIRNNIAKIDQAAGIAGAFGVFATATGTFTCDYNDFVAVSYFGRRISTNYANLSAWKTGTGLDANSRSVDPMTGTSPGVWTSATNLRFTGFPGGLNAGTVIATPAITTDIDGNARDASRPFPGMYEQSRGRRSRRHVWIQHRLTRRSRKPTARMDASTSRLPSRQPGSSVSGNSKGVRGAGSSYSSSGALCHAERGVGKRPQAPARE